MMEDYKIENNRFLFRRNDKLKYYFTNKLKHKTIFFYCFKNIKFASYQKFVKSKAIYNYDITRDPSEIFRLF